MPKDKVENYFSHDADMGIIGRGKTVEKAFEAAAQSVFAIMVEPRLVAPTFSISIEFIEEDVELALVTWINGLLTAARENALVFSQFTLRREDHRWQGTAWGDKWHVEWERGTEVKGATLTLLSVRQVNDNWEVRCVVDV